ncbi:DUF4352 domain-containing protein [Peribacillus sp. NPDC046944]|uniref:DUF4352 domain-containing protein n=1 Tax=unclassified Peribacillus TaxID=2675266 RepID=UPI003D02009C
MAGLTSCKTCNKEIAKGVKKCPNCGKDQRNWFRRHKFLTFIGAIIVIIIIANSVGGDESPSTSSSSTKEATNKENMYKVGDVIKQNKLEITVLKQEEFDTIGDPEFLGKKASEGGTLIAIQYKMKNISDEPVGMFSYPSIKLVDEKGTKFDSDIEASTAYAVEAKVDDSKVLSDLNPDISVTDTEVYEISKEKFSKGKWYIQIGDAKVQIK